MARRKPLDLPAELLDAFDHSARVSEHLVSVVPADAWRAVPSAGGRTIAANVAHMQSVRRTFAKMGGAAELPSIDRLKSTQAQAVRALRASREALVELFAAAIEQGDGRVGRMPRRTMNMLFYLVQHDAHHRGQITWTLRRLGYELAPVDVTRLWGWRKLDA